MFPDVLIEPLERAACHIFDVDHTLVRRSTGRRFAQIGHARGIIPLAYLSWLPIFYLRYRFGRLNVQDLSIQITPLTGRTREELQDVANEAWERHIRDDLYGSAMEYVQRCHARHATVILASTSFDIILEPLARHLEADETIASVLEFAEGRATGWISGGPCYAQRKSERITELLARRGIAPTSCAFYTDSFRDLASLESVGYPVTVHPDSMLRRIAIRRAWPIVRWRR